VKSNYRPKAVDPNQFVMNEMADEILVYHLETQKAHSLNSTAAKVWALCDGRKSVEEIALAIKDGDAAPDIDLVWLSLGQLEQASLLHGKLPPAGASYSRRQVIRKLTQAAAVLPVVSSVLIPRPAAAQSLDCTECVKFNPPKVTCANSGNCGPKAGDCHFGNNSCGAMGGNVACATCDDCAMSASNSFIITTACTPLALCKDGGGIQNCTGQPDATPCCIDPMAGVTNGKCNMGNCAP
jgi:hypothetical protein